MSSPHCRLDKLGSLGFSLMPTPLGSPRALSSWDAGLQEETPVPDSPEETCVSEQKLVLPGYVQCWMCSAYVSQPES